MGRIRVSLRELEQLYISGVNKKPLEDVIRAFVGIQAKDPTDPDSFFCLAAHHGMPFRFPDFPYDPKDPKNQNGWWGGYCNHENVLFPMWHRGFLVRFENALRSIEGCQNVTLPFWDECAVPNSAEPIPKILTQKTFILDGKEIPNPLYSYKLPVDIDDEFSRETGQPVWPKGLRSNRYRRPKGYETVRFPLSGLVGTEDDRATTRAWNAQYANDDVRIKILNGNVANWLNGTIDVKAVGGEVVPDLTSVVGRYKSCLETPTYNCFSNVSSARHSISTYGKSVTSLEGPHDAIHLALGGFYQQGKYIASAETFIKANGDMGDNETAALDPIFFLHHAFIDYVFWTWQKRHGKSEVGSLRVTPDDPGARIEKAQPGLPAGSLLSTDTPLRPFRKDEVDGTSNADFLTSNDLVNIEKQLGYTYGPGSLDHLVSPATGRVGSKSDSRQPLRMIKEISGINRGQYRGSFIIRTFATTLSGKKVEVGREPVLSRWNIQDCANCQNRLDIKSYVPIDCLLATCLRETGRDEDVKYEVEIQTIDHESFTALPGGGQSPTIRDLQLGPRCENGHLARLGKKGLSRL